MDCCKIILNHVTKSLRISFINFWINRREHRGILILYFPRRLNKDMAGVADGQLERAKIYLGGVPLGTSAVYPY